MPAKRYAVVEYAVVRILTIAANRTRSCVLCIRFRRGAAWRDAANDARVNPVEPRLSSFSRSEANFVDLSESAEGIPRYERWRNH